MRISRRSTIEDHRGALERAAGGETVDGRVCGAHCSARCPRCGAGNCQCQCSAYCSDAPRLMTGDPAFPIELLIAPLVFEMKRTGFFEPCWSCEGHAGADGGVLKAPAVWFYCAEGAPLRLLAGGLSRLRLHASWRVTLTHSDNDNPEPTFALEPTRDGHTLAQLQADASAIARAMPELLRSEARALLGR